MTTEEYMDCPNCKKELISGCVYCPNCGYDLRRGEAGLPLERRLDIDKQRVIAWIQEQHDPDQTVEKHLRDIATTEKLSDIERIYVAFRFGAAMGGPMSTLLRWLRRRE